MEYKKISDTELEISETIIKKYPIGIDQLEYDKDSLQRTIIANDKVNTETKVKILSQIKEIDVKISEAKKLGIMTNKEYELANPVIIPIKPIIKPIAETATTTNKII